MARMAVGRHGWLRALRRLARAIVCVHGVMAAAAIAEGGQIFTLPDTQSRPPRDASDVRDVRPIPQPTGTAVIRGHIVDAETGQPIARARVSLSGAAEAEPAVVTSGQDGAFEFLQLTAGEFSIAAEKVTYERGTYPDQLARGLRTTRLSLAAGQALERVTVPLYRLGVVTGRITDAYGDPLENCVVRTLRVLPGGRLRYMQAGATNDIGEFRLARVQAGKYLLLAQPQRAMQIDGVIDGVMRGARSAPRRGAQAPAASQGADERQATPGVTFYPGTTEVQQAQVVTLGRGQTVAALDWAIADVMQTVVSGRAIERDGRPVRGGNVQVSVVLPDDVTGRLFFSSANIDSDGNFAMKLQPGQYQLDAFIAGNRYRPTSGIASILGAPGDTATIPSRHGHLEISVGGEPLSELTLPMSPERTAAGTVVFEGNSPRPAEPRSVSVTFQNAPGPWPECRSFNSSDGVQADWSFRVTQLLGTCAPLVTAPPPWHVKAVRHRGVDVLGRGFDFTKDGDLSGLEVILTDRESSLTLDVRDESGGGQTMEYVAVVFAVDKSRWSDERYVQTYVPPRPPGGAGPGVNAAIGGVIGGVTGGMIGGTVPSSGIGSSYRMDSTGRGEATLTGLPAGDYFIVALTDAGQDEVREPAFLESLVSRATRVTVGETEPQTVSLTRTTAPDFDR